MNVVSLPREFYINDFVKKNIRSQNFPAYPACNLLYFILLTTLKQDNNAYTNVILETGTYHAVSTAVIAQAVDDINIRSTIYSIEIGPQEYSFAVQNFKQAGVRTPVEFILGDSHIEIPKLLEKIDKLDFAFLDGDHSFNGVYSEFNLIKDLVKKSNGYIYFDNTEAGGVNEALIKIKSENDCNLIRFPNCSYSPCGQALLHF